MANSIGAGVCVQMDVRGTDMRRCCLRSDNVQAGKRWEIAPPFDVVGLPRGIRTPDRRLRRPMLYPTELWADSAQCDALAGAPALRLPQMGVRDSIRWVAGNGVSPGPASPV